MSSNLYNVVDNLPIPLYDVIRLIEDSYNNYTICVNEVECLVVEFHIYQVVIPRGTEFDKFISGGGWLDVIRDLRAIPWPSRLLRGWSHAGFLKGAKGVVNKGLFGLLRRDKPIIVLGHSLGGSLGQNIAYLLAAEDFYIKAVITIGSPRTFTKGTARRLKERFKFPVYEFSNPGDPIPDVPFRFWGYRHINEIQTNRKAIGYSIKNNHLLPAYAQWANYVLAKN